jgi:hypothetical protein
MEERDDECMVDRDECIRLWPSLRRRMIRGIRKKDFTDIQSFIKWFFCSEFPGAELYPELSRLLFIVCVLPVGSCEVERSFSHMKAIKTRAGDPISSHR